MHSDGGIKTRATKKRVHSDPVLLTPWISARFKRAFDSCLSPSAQAAQEESEEGQLANLLDSGSCVRKSTEGQQRIAERSRRIVRDRVRSSATAAVAGCEDDWTGFLIKN